MEGYMDHHTWLVSNNLLTDEMKDNIAMAGYCIIEDVNDVETTIDFNARVITYHLLLPEDLYDNLQLLKKFEDGQSLGFFENRKLKKFIQQKREHDETGMGYRLELIANKFVRAYLDSNWSTDIKLFKVGDEKGDNWLHIEGNQQSD